MKLSTKSSKRQIIHSNMGKSQLSTKDQNLNQHSNLHQNSNFNTIEYLDRNQVHHGIEENSNGLEQQRFDSHEEDDDHFQIIQSMKQKERLLKEIQSLKEKVKKSRSKYNNKQSRNINLSEKQTVQSVKLVTSPLNQNKRSKSFGVKMNAISPFEKIRQKKQYKKINSVKQVTKFNDYGKPYKIQQPTKFIDSNHCHNHNRNFNHANHSSTKNTNHNPGNRKSVNDSMCKGYLEIIAPKKLQYNPDMLMVNNRSPNKCKNRKKCDQTDELKRKQYQEGKRQVERQYGLQNKKVVDNSLKIPYRFNLQF